MQTRRRGVPPNVDIKYAEDLIKAVRKARRQEQLERNRINHQYQSPPPSPSQSQEEEQKQTPIDIDQLSRQFIQTHREQNDDLPENYHLDNWQQTKRFTKFLFQGYDYLEEIPNAFMQLYLGTRKLNPNENVQAQDRIFCMFILLWVRSMDDYDKNGVQPLDDQENLLPRYKQYCFRQFMNLFQKPQLVRNDKQNNLNQIAWQQDIIQRMQQLINFTYTNEMGFVDFRWLLRQRAFFENRIMNSTVLMSNINNLKQRHFINCDNENNVQIEHGFNGVMPLENWVFEQHIDFPLEMANWRAIDEEENNELNINRYLKLIVGQIQTRNQFRANSRYILQINIKITKSYDHGVTREFSRISFNYELPRFEGFEDTAQFNNNANLGQIIRQRIVDQITFWQERYTQENVELYSDQIQINQIGLIVINQPARDQPIRAWLRQNNTEFVVGCGKIQKCFHGIAIRKTQIFEQGLCLYESFWLCTQKFAYQTKSQVLKRRIFDDFYGLNEHDKDLFFSGSIKRLLDEIIDPMKIKVNV